jgi:3-phosphoshikimate 1-carboxyvinyltransferase
LSVILLIINTLRSIQSTSNLTEMNIDLRDLNKWTVSIELNRSKSITIRYLIFHFLKNGELLAIRDNDADDVRIVHDNLAVIGDTCRKSFPFPVVINVGDCGAAYRFLLSVLAVTEGNWLLTGSERLLSRPVDSLIEALKSCGASIKKNKKGILITGKKFSASGITIDCTDSSQFASSLLLISETIGLKELKILPEKPASAGYIAMTKQILKEIDSHGIHVNSLEIESDWSSAAFWYAMVALNEEAVCELPGLKIDSLQSDSRIIGIFDSLNVITTQTSNGIVIKQNQFFKRNKISKLALNLSENPDLAPIFAVLSILLKIELNLFGLKNINFKESNRLEILGKALSPFAKIKIINEESLHISEIKDCSNQNLHFDSYHDHRLAMAFTLFATRNKVIIDNFEAVSKSYPDFIRDINKISH